MNKVKEVLVALVLCTLLFSGAKYLLTPAPIVLHIPPIIGGMTEQDMNSEQDKLDHMADLIRNAKVGQEVDLYINSYGGSVFAGMTLMNALHDTKGHVVAILDGAVMSEASSIALACSEIRVESESLVLIHMAFDGNPAGGKDPILSWINDDIMPSIWTGILTPDELASVRAGVPWIVTGDVLKDRFDHLHHLGVYSNDPVVSLANKLVDKLVEEAHQLHLV